MIRVDVRPTLAVLLSLACSSLACRPTAHPSTRPALIGDAIRRARQLALAGRRPEAERLLSQSTQRPGSVTGTARALNARVLHLHGQLRALTARTVRERVIVETYFAWAISEEPEVAEYWHDYVQARLQRERRVFFEEIQRREPIVYDLRDIGLSQQSTTLHFPWGNEWDYLGSIAEALSGHLPEADAHLNQHRHDACHEDETRGEIAYMLGDLRRADDYLNGIPSACPTTRSARLRYYRGLSALGRGDAGAAQREFEAAFQLDDYSLSEYAAHAQIRLTRIGREVGAPPRDPYRRVLLDLVEREPAAWAAWDALWSRYYAGGAGRIVEFDSISHAVSERAPNAAAPRLAAALALIAQGDDDAARSAIDNTLQKEPNDSNAIGALLALAVLRRDSAAIAVTVQRLNSGGGWSATAGEATRLADLVALSHAESVAEAERRAAQENAMAVLTTALAGSPFAELVIQRLAGGDPDVRLRVIQQAQAITSRQLGVVARATAATVHRVDRLENNVDLMRDSLQSRIVALVNALGLFRDTLRMLRGEIVLHDRQISAMSAEFRRFRSEQARSAADLATRLRARDACFDMRIDEIVSLVAGVRTELDSLARAQGLNGDDLGVLFDRDTWRNHRPEAIANAIRVLTSVIEATFSVSAPSARLVTSVKPISLLVLALIRLSRYRDQQTTRPGSPILKTLGACA